MSTDTPTTDDDTSTESEETLFDTTVSARSEILFITDAKNCNPNGNPSAVGNPPRIDPQTKVCVITDVRLKRYSRDQLASDGHGVYITDMQTEDGNQATRADLVESRLSEVNINDYDLDPDSDDNNAEAVKRLKEDVFGALLRRSADIRYFGATLSVKGGNTDFADYLPENFTGPVQFSPAESLNAVVENEESNSLTSVIATQEGKDQGGYELSDKRIKYGIFPFHAVVNEHNADDTGLSPDDVARLDTLLWRSIKNQTNTRSKKGQEPRLYLRAEYEEGFHVGDLEQAVSLDRGQSAPDEQIRGITDLTLDISLLIQLLSRVQDRINKIRVVADPLLEVTDGNDTGGPDVLYDALRDIVGDDTVEIIDVYGEHTETLPANSRP
jgi:CRISPR-associated protein Csh2